MVDAIAYNDKPEEVCYRAKDCPEGRQLLNLLAKLQKREDIPFPELKNGKQQEMERQRQKLAYEQRSA